jgi:hypothetical protein
MKMLIQQRDRSKLVSFAFTKSPEMGNSMTLDVLDGKNDVQVNCEATARLMKSMAF